MVYDGVQSLLRRTYVKESADIIYLRDSYRHKLGNAHNIYIPTDNISARFIVSLDEEI